MTAVPPAGYPSNAAITQGAMKTFDENILSILKEVIGVGPKQTLTLNASNQITPVNECSVYALDTYLSASAQNLDNFFNTNMRNGGLYAFCGANSGHAVTFRDSQGASNKFILADGVNFLLEGPNDWILMYYSSASSGTLTEVMRSSLFRLRRLPGNQQGVNLSIVSDELTPTQFLNYVDPEGGTGPDNCQTINWSYPGLTLALFTMKDASETVVWKHSTGVAGKIYLRDNVDLTMNSKTQYLLLERRGVDAYEIARFGFADDYIYSGGRLSGSSTLPYPGDITGCATLYHLAAGEDGNYCSFYKGGKWIPTKIGSASIAPPNVKYCPFFVHGYLDSSDAEALEAQRWDGGSQTTGSITGVSIAAAAVITSNSHGLNIGDIVCIDSITGTVGTDAKAGLNSRANDVRQFVITATTTNTFTIDAISTGLAYTSGGTWYKVPAAPALGTQDGVDVKSGDPTRRLIGGGMTGFTAGQCDQTSTSMHVISHLSQIVNAGVGQIDTNSHTYNGATMRPFDNDHSKRVRWLSLVSRGVNRLSAYSSASNSSSGVAQQRVMVDNTTGTGALDSQVFQFGVVNAGFTFWLGSVFSEAAGSHYAAIGELSTAGSSTFASFTQFKMEIPR